MAIDLVRRAKQRAYRVLPLGLLERWLPRRVIGLHYHVVSNEPLPHVRHLYGFKTPAQFEDDVRWLARHYRLLSYSDLVDRLRDPAPPSGKPAAILTFDDGYKECHSVVRPILLRQGIPCTFFLTTHLIGNATLFHRNLVSLCLEAAGALDEGRATTVLHDLWPDAAARPSARAMLARRLRALRDAGPLLDRACDRLAVDGARFLREARPYLSRAEALALAGDGFTLGAHTRTHPVLDGQLSAERLDWEVAGSCDDLCALTGAVQVPFAFPVTGDHVDRDALAALRTRHASIGLVFDTGRLRHDRDFVVHRVPVERPRPAVPPGESNVPDHLRRAYVTQLLREARGALGGGGSRPAR